MNHTAAKRLEDQWIRLARERSEVRSRLNSLINDSGPDFLISRELRLTLLLGEAMRQIQFAWLTNHK